MARNEITHLIPSRMSYLGLNNYLVSIRSIGITLNKLVLSGGFVLRDSSPKISEYDNILTKTRYHPALFLSNKKSRRGWRSFAGEIITVITTMKRNDSNGKSRAHTPAHSHHLLSL